MTQEEIVIKALEKIATSLESIATVASQPKVYTISGAADWPMLVIMFGVIAALIGFMWTDLIRRFDTKCTTCKTEIIRENEAQWDAMDKCQAECCPRGKQT